MVDYPTCEICKEEPGVVVNSMPGIPMSISRGENCIKNDLSYPYWALVAETSITGGMEHADQWWHEEVEYHLPFFKKSMSEFQSDVNKSIKEEMEYWKEQERKDDGLPPRDIMEPPNEQSGF